MWSERISWHTFASPINDVLLGGISHRQPVRTPNAYAIWEDFRVLPLRPIWPFFAINTIFYAAILWLLFFAPGSVRRMIRRRRGLCPACAYPVGTSPVCTECGKPVIPKSVEPR
jgi:hypothetical protein